MEFVGIGYADDSHLTSLSKGVRQTAGWNGRAPLDKGGKRLWQDLPAKDVARLDLPLAVTNGDGLRDWVLVVVHRIGGDGGALRVAYLVDLGDDAAMVITNDHG